MHPFSHVFGEVKKWFTLKLHEMIRVSHVVACPTAFFTVRGYSVIRKMIIFRYLGALPNNFRQVKEWPVLELHRIIRVSYVALCQIVFILLFDLDLEQECSDL